MLPFVFKPADYPAKPGCYLMKNAKGRVIYVGKAKRLRTRLSSYFQPSQKARKVLRLVQQVADIEVIIVNNEYESLVLENNLIKLYRPRFNRLLKPADSGYYYIHMTGERYPRFLRFRKNRYVKALEGLREVTTGIRFGPYIRDKHREVILEFVNDNFRLRTCKPLGSQVCLRYHLGKCSGICAGKVSDKEYAEQVRNAVALLSRPQDELARQMRAVMQKYAERLEFEKAQKVKLQVEALEQGLQQQIVEKVVDHNQDALYFGVGGVLVAQLNHGILERLTLFPLPVGTAEKKARQDFLLAHYSRRCPDELIVNELEDAASMQAKLSDLHGRRVSISMPKRGLKHSLLLLCEQNFHYRMKRLAKAE